MGTYGFCWYLTHRSGDVRVLLVLVAEADVDDERGDAVEEDDDADEDVELRRRVEVTAQLRLLLSRGRRAERQPDGRVAQSVRNYNKIDLIWIAGYKRRFRSHFTHLRRCANSPRVVGVELPIPIGVRLDLRKRWGSRR